MTPAEQKKTKRPLLIPKNQNFFEFDPTEWLETKVERIAIPLY